MFDPASVRIRGPLVAHVQGFWTELRGQGYAAESAGNLLRLVAYLGRWLQARGLVLADLREDVVAEFLRSRRRRGCRHYFTRRAVAPLLSHLRKAGAIPMPMPIVDNSAAGRLTREYAAYLRQERGLAASTIRGYSDFAARFVRCERPRLDWDRLTAAAVTKFVLRSARESRRIGTAKLTVTHLKSLLRFLHARGAIDRDLSTCVPAVAGWRLAGVPAALEQSEIDRLLSAFDRSKTGLRDAAVVRLLLRLGLRAGEVAALNIDDVDWRAGELSVHGKGRHQSRLPLPADVGCALAAYVRHGRPNARTRSLILRVKAPNTGMRAGAIIHVVRTALKRAGLTGSAHLLRHTAATQLLRHGASLPEIAHLLRHRHIDTTAIYAKVDLAALGSVARPWPGGTP